MKLSTEAIDRHLTLIAGIAFELNGSYKSVKLAIIRAVDRLGYSPDRAPIYQEWLDSRDVVKMALDKYRRYFGASYEQISLRHDPDQ